MLKQGDGSESEGQDAARRLNAPAGMLSVRGTRADQSSAHPGGPSRFKPRVRPGLSTHPATRPDLSTNARQCGIKFVSYGQGRSCQVASKCVETVETGPKSPRSLLRWVTPRQSRLMMNR